VIQKAFPERCFLTPRQQSSLLSVIAEHELAGGSVYDAMVGDAAKQNDRTLITRDVRAERIYQRLSVKYVLVRS
jgi:hypothetical protein